MTDAGKQEAPRIKRYEGDAKFIPSGLYLVLVDAVDLDALEARNQALEAKAAALDRETKNG